MLPANYEYSRSDRQDLVSSIQMQLFEKPRPFYQFYIAFLEFTLYFEYFEKIVTIIAQVFLKLFTSKLYLLKRIKTLFSENLWQ